MACCAKKNQEVQSVEEYAGFLTLHEALPDQEREDPTCTSRNNIFFQPIPIPPPALLKNCFVLLFVLYSSSGSGLAPSGSSSGSNPSSTRERDREREREAMDPIAELLSQLSGVRRGLSGVSGASGLGSVLGLGALGSLGGALGSLGSMQHQASKSDASFICSIFNYKHSLLGNLGGPTPGSGLPAPNGRGRGLLGIVGRDSAGAFSELVSNGVGNGQSQPQLERHQV